MDDVKFRTDLKCTDFPIQKIIVQHDDGSRLELNYAFIEEDKLIRSKTCVLDIIKVYSEHNGDHWFVKGDLRYYKIEPIYPKSLVHKFKKIIEYWKSFSLI